MHGRPLSFSFLLSRLPCSRGACVRRRARPSGCEAHARIMRRCIICEPLGGESSGTRHDSEAAPSSALVWCTSACSAFCRGVFGPPKYSHASRTGTVLMQARPPFPVLFVLPESLFRACVVDEHVVSFLTLACASYFFDREEEGGEVTAYPLVLSTSTIDYLFSVPKATSYGIPGSCSSSQLSTDRYRELLNLH